MASVNRSLALLRHHVIGQLDNDAQREVWSEVIVPSDSDGGVDRAFRIPADMVLSCGIPTITDLLQEKNAKLQKLLSKLFPDPLSVPPSSLSQERPAPIRIVGVWWSWMLCYGEGNEFVFPENRVVWLMGNNGSGKTAFQDVLVMGLFGTGIPSRCDSDTSGYDFANYRRPDDARPCVKVRLQYDGRSYVVHRVWSGACAAKDGKKGALLMNSSVKDVTDPQSPVVVCKTNGAVKDWVTRHVGSKDHFLRCAALSQYNDGDFFDMDGARQLDILMDDVDDDDIADKQTSQACVEVLKLLGSSVNTLVKCVMASRDTVATTMPATDNADVETMREDRATLETSIDELRSLMRDNREVWHPPLRALGIRDVPSEAAVSERIRDLEERVKHLVRQDEDVVVRDEVSEESDQVKEWRRELRGLEAEWSGKPFNPSCSACRAQAWRVQMRQLQSMISNATCSPEPVRAKSSQDDLRDTLEHQLRLWRQLDSARGTYLQFVELNERYRSLKSREADLSVAIERHKVQEEKRRRCQVLDTAIQGLKEYAAVVSKARAIVAGYRCWVLEHRILPEFVRNMNTVLQCFPNNDFDVSVSKLPVRSESEELFVPLWKVQCGNVSLIRGGGFERSMVNCAARISLGRMFHSDRINYEQVIIDELLVSSDANNRQHIPAFLKNLVDRLGYSSIVYTCHIAPTERDEEDPDFFCTAEIHRDGSGDCSLLNLLDRHHHLESV